MATQPFRIPARMRAFAIDEFGDRGTLRHLPTPHPRAGEVLIRVRAAGVNPVDWKVRDGFIPLPQAHFPCVLGSDVAGIIEQTGPNSSRYREGDEVYGSVFMGGSFAEFMVVPEEGVLALKPRTLDFAGAAALPIAGLTALAVVEALRLRPGQSILVVGASGGVGSFVVQLAAMQGAHVVATARADAADAVEELGARDVIDHSNNDVVAATRGIYPGGVDAVAELVDGPAEVTHVAAALKSGGRLVSILGAADAAALGQQNVHGLNANMKRSSSALADLSELVDSGRLSLPRLRAFPLEDAALALDESKRGHVRGKLVLTV